MRARWLDRQHCCHKKKVGGETTGPQKTGLGSPFPPKFCGTFGVLQKGSVEEFAYC